ncbi:hypothetical protein D3C79_909160 [compost metagenome]
MNLFKIITSFILLLSSLTTGGAADSYDNPIYEYPVASDQITDPSMREIGMMLKEAGLEKYWDTLKHQILPGFYMIPKMTDEAVLQSSR